MSASIAYFALLSLFPLALMTVALASIWLDVSLAEAELVQRLEFIAPGLQTLLGQNIEYVIRSRAPVSGFAFLTVLWSASNIFNIITRGLNRIWDIENERSAWRHRGLAMAVAIVLSATLLITMFMGGFVATAREAITIPAGLNPEVITLTNSFIGACINVVAFAAFYYFLPHRQADWLDVSARRHYRGLLMGNDETGLFELRCALSDAKQPRLWVCGDDNRLFDLVLL